MEHLAWRRDKIQELSSKGHSQREIASMLQISLGSVNRDLSYLKNQAKENIRKYIDERLPEEYEKCLVGLNSIVKEAWTTSQQTQDSREKMQALSLAKDCYAMKLELLTNATVVDDAIRFVSGHAKPTTSITWETGTSTYTKKSNNTTIKETQETDYAQQPGKITTNQVF